MVVTWILNLFMSGLTSILTLLPTWSVISWAGFNVGGTARSPVFDWLIWANYYLPIDQVVLILGASATLMVAVWGVKGTLWVLTKLHVVGGAE